MYSVFWVNQCKIKVFRRDLEICTIRKLYINQAQTINHDNFNYNTSYRFFLALKCKMLFQTASLNTENLVWLSDSTGLVFILISLYKMNK